MSHSLPFLSTEKPIASAHPSLQAVIRRHSHVVCNLTHSSIISGSSHHHVSTAIYSAQTSIQSILPTIFRSSCLMVSSDGWLFSAGVSCCSSSGTAENCVLVILPLICNDAFSNQIGSNLLGFMQRKFVSKFNNKLCSIHARNNGPRELVSGSGSTSTRCKAPLGLRHRWMFLRTPGISWDGVDKGRRNE